MILGVGIDMVEVADLERRIEKAAFLRNVFSERERSYAECRPAHRAEILAARWAAKEAFGKALGTGLRAEWPLAELEILDGPAGRPVIELGPALRALVPSEARVHCSLSHTGGYACACVIIETA